MTMPNQYGGVVVPDMQKYYQAADMGRLIDWCRHVDLKLWSNIQQSQSMVPWCRAVWCFADLSPALKKHPIVVYMYSGSGN